ncbi:MAG: hypothetical protein WC613_01190 [Candidatus Aenigmatarchaeota archaeon]
MTVARGILIGGAALLIGAAAYCAFRPDVIVERRAGYTRITDIRQTREEVIVNLLGGGSGRTREYEDFDGDGNVDRVTTTTCTTVIPREPDPAYTDCRKNTSNVFEYRDAKRAQELQRDFNELLREYGK